MDQFLQWNQARSGERPQSQSGNIEHIPAQHNSQSYMDLYSQNLFQSQSSDYMVSQGLYGTEKNQSQLEDEIVKTHSSKKRKSKMSVRNGSPKKGTPNKRWAPEFDDYLIPFLVEQAKKGMKVDKTFKKQAFTAAAAAVNAQFNESFIPDNVVNHYRVLKTRYVNICKCQSISGAGWDNENKIITLEGPTYHTWAQAHPHLKEFVNKPLKHYDEMKIICGDDHATGSYRKVIFEQFGGNNNDACEPSGSALVLMFSSSIMSPATTSSPMQLMHFFVHFKAKC